MFLRILLIFSGAFCVCAEKSLELCHVFGCYDSSDTQLCTTLDDDEVYYADFKKEILIWDSKIPSSFHVPWAYKYALKYRTMCKEPPDIIMYSRDEVVKEEDNTLICFINNFFPPKINITWTKNDIELTEEEPFITFLPNPDGTFHFFSRLDFTPTDGDIYSCTVEHEALETPQTKFWEVEIEEASSGPAIFCGLGLTLGVLGVVGGTFLFVKGNHYQGVLEPSG
ncbi:H-2 class II histocompatibility antigen, A-Q alpha chain-like isoform X2 [Stegastes partitus]|uniref:H-2 class II histocompatibility antigen, A-Q alpha chain-like isoform X2 n=1 Tax=Stegastes partitus TaxID=144197 RepID=A0A9Y4K8H2_9TELE|nr:PREDICTED: H-2 class II histocompatibility antigen, A-Q alpha chain-like isoform X2 [Stegastes partitus]